MTRAAPSDTDRPAGDPGTSGASGIDAVLVAGGVIVVALALLGMVATGAFGAPRLLDPGALVTVGLPVARAVSDAAAAVAIGLLLLVTFALPGRTELRGVVSFSQWSAVRWATRFAAAWVAAALAMLVLTAADVLGMPLSASGFAEQAVYFATSIELGQTLLVSLGCAIVVLVLLLVTRNVSWLATATLVAVFALLPLSLSGHAAGADEHGNAVSGLAIHIVGVSAWTGGLVGLLLLRRSLGDSLAVVASRYSVLAGWAFAAVALSGVANASLRLAGPADLVSGYGLLLVAKTAILVALGVVGAVHRRRMLPRLEAGPGNRLAFVRLAAGEVVLLAVAMGLSVALSRSAPPVSQEPETADAFRSLVGYGEPPPFSALGMLTEWHADWAFLLLAGVLAGTYLAGVRILRRRGDVWPVGRTVAWLLGCAGLAYLTSGAPGVYGPTSFSTHMLQHMGLMMFVPPLLVLGAPVLLALRALPVRRDGSRGIREWILIVVHSRYARFVATPVVAAVIFAGSLVVFYYTSWFPFSLSEHQGHVLMVLHFLLSGYLFYWVLIGVDPGISRPAYPIRLIVLLATLAFHAFFGLALMSQSDILAIDWWHALGRMDDEALLADQRVGGGLAMGAGEVPTVLVALMVVRQWVRSDARTARRTDRAADRDGDAELRAYNARLAALGERDRAGGRTPAEPADRS